MGVDKQAALAYTGLYGKQQIRKQVARMDRAGDVRRLREAAGLQAGDVAQKAGISRNYLSLLEGGKRPLGLDLYTTILSAISDLREERERSWQEAVASVGGKPIDPQVPTR